MRNSDILSILAIVLSILAIVIANGCNACQGASTSKFKKPDISIGQAYQMPDTSTPPADCNTYEVIGFVQGTQWCILIDRCTSQVYFFTQEEVRNKLIFKEE